MKTKLDLGLGMAVLALALVAGTGATAVAAKPHKVSAPKLGVYGGDSFSEGKTHVAFAKVTKQRSKYSAEVEVAFPAKCVNQETGFAGPSELVYRFLAPVKGNSISFKGNTRDVMGIIYPVDSTITLTGHFAANSEFAGTATVKAPGEGLESIVTCTAPAAKLKLRFELPLMA